MTIKIKQSEALLKDTDELIFSVSTLKEYQEIVKKEEALKVFDFLIEKGFSLDDLYKAREEYIDGNFKNEN